MASDARALALKIMEDLWNQKTPALIDELFADNCVIHTPDGALYGIEGAKQLYAAYVSSSPMSILRLRISLPTRTKWQSVIRFTARISVT